MSRWPYPDLGQMPSFTKLILMRTLDPKPLRRRAQTSSVTLKRTAILAAHGLKISIM
jgi:hypothetical protein